MSDGELARFEVLRDLVIDKHQQSALRPAILKPPMLAAIDLHQLADTLAPAAGLMNPLDEALRRQSARGKQHAR
jgi:hypothetical protein